MVQKELDLLASILVLCKCSSHRYLLFVTLLYLTQYPFVKFDSNRNSDIWRDIPQLLQKVVVRPLFSIFFLTTEQGAQTSIAGAVGNLPSNAIYLQPYWLPFAQKQRKDINLSFARRYALAFPMFEFMGPYVGHAITEPRLPISSEEQSACAEAFWNACEKVTSNYHKK